MDLNTRPLAASGAPSAPAGDAHRPESGWLLGGRYRVAERLGAGGMAEVFRAHDELLGRDVAVKVFRTVVDATAGGLERQENELRALARLSHPNLITLFDASVEQTPAYLVMEFVNGPSLAARLEADGQVPEPEVRLLGAQLADALAYVHAQGMVHRDVKPANILLGVDDIAGTGAGRARLSDFGIVRLLGSDRMTRADLTLGTASYLAPEQARGGDVQPPADVYSLGLVLIEALTGRRSFDGPPMEAVLARLTRSPEVPPGLPAPWPALLTAMTSADPAARPSAAQVAAALDEPGADSTVLLAAGGVPYRGFPSPSTSHPAGPPYVPITGSYGPPVPSGGYPAAEPAARRRLSAALLGAVVVAVLLLGGAALALSRAVQGSSGSGSSGAGTGASSTAPPGVAASSPARAAVPGSGGTRPVTSRTSATTSAPVTAATTASAATSTAASAVPSQSSAPGGSLTPSPPASSPSGVTRSSGSPAASTTGTAPGVTATTATSAPASGTLSSP